MFHRVSDNEDPLWNPIPVKKFELLIRNLKNNVCIIHLEELKKIKIYPEKPLVVISFDDGYKDFYENALPILIKYDVPAHHNICPGLIDKKILPWTQIVNLYLSNNTHKKIELPDKTAFEINNENKEINFLNLLNILYKMDNSMLNEWIVKIVQEIPKYKLDILMNWDMIRECSRAGIRIGSHSLMHQNLSQLTNEDELSTEIVGSKIRIKNEIDIDPKIFAFPNGLYNKKSMEMVINAGFTSILLCDDMVSVLNKEFSREKSYVLPRINMSGSEPDEQYLRLLGFHQKLTQAFKGKPYKVI